MSLALGVAFVVAHPRPSAAAPDDEPKPHYFVGASYALGRNLWPNRNSGEPPLFSDVALTLGIGRPADPPGYLVELELAGLVGHNEETDSDLLFGVSARASPWRHSVVRVRAATQLRNATPRTTIVGIYAGATMANQRWVSTLEVGWIIGEHRDNGYINLIELRIGFSRNLGIGTRCTTTTRPTATARRP
ncbi:MAG: hypothetical protein AB7R00_02125 [Kofleriaceae bacterium]